MKKVQGRLIKRSVEVDSQNPLDDKNETVDFYKINTVHGWADVRFAKDVEVVDCPALVEIEVYSAKLKTSVLEDGTEFINKILYANKVTAIESAPEFEKYEADKLEAKITKTFV
jgi:hypothetical protein